MLNVLVLQPGTLMIENRFLRFFTVLTVMLFLVSCHNEAPQDNRVLLAEVGTSKLYKDEVDLMLAANDYGSDSAQFVDDYIEHWAMEELYQHLAARNVASTAEIDKMVEGYRKSLILNLYQESLVNQHLKSSVADADIKEFYELNKVLFDSDENMMKGILLVLPTKAPSLNKVRKWCIDMTPEAMESLEAYSAENAVQYDYFMDDWRSFEDLVKRLPLTEGQLLDRLSKKSTIEFKEDGQLYFVCADTIIRQGDTMPIELVSAEINELLVNSRKAEFIKTKKVELYNDAKLNGDVKFYK